SRHVRRQHAWSVHGGVVAVPSASPSMETLTPLAGLRGPFWNLMRAFACESIDHWYKVEPHLWRAVPSLNQVMAGRDAMARIMYRCAATPQSERARQLRVRAADYRRETYAAEQELRCWLLTVAAQINERPWTPTPKSSGG